ncbi:N-acetyltransferase [Desulfonema limicola]|uniref:N-acetyltransferase n=1 Tax=Desulfonema limicola TaxID=45656 RepID=A0A975GG61_9BACT|nr:arylamine N-acetyltransferase [Desulfonema limicola]QTA79919.1 N-acetyltransferase [Desulfonema limicola]
MDDKVFNPDDYLKRINHCHVDITEEGLEALHSAQVYTIPFENFDILLGRGISLEQTAIFNKLVKQRRGGYCFELNGLFLMALQYFGFDARPLLARVHVSGTPMGRGHQISLVTIKGKHWIADVGFGSPHLPAPLLLEINHPVTLNNHTFCLVDAGPFGIMLQILKNDVGQNIYSFDLGHVCTGDITYGNHFASTHPDSYFTFSRIAALPVHDGRISLFNLRLKKIIRGREEVQELTEGQAYLDALKIHFGIELNVPYEALPQIQIKNPGHKSLLSRF